MLGSDREGEALAFSQILRLALQRRDGDRPLARAPCMDLADLASENDPLDGCREPVPACGRGGPHADRFGRTEMVTAVPWLVWPGIIWPISRPSGVRTTTSPRWSFIWLSSWPCSRLVGPSIRATKTSWGRE